MSRYGPSCVFLRLRLLQVLSTAVRPRFDARSGGLAGQHLLLALDLQQVATQFVFLFAFGIDLAGLDMSQLLDSLRLDTRPNVHSLIESEAATVAEDEVGLVGMRRLMVVLGRWLVHLQR